MPQPFISTPAVLAEAVLLLSPWKPLLLLLPFIPWALLISKVYDKHAARFFLAREQWGIFHLSMGVAAIAVGLGVAMIWESQFSILLALVATTLVLAIDVIAYPMVVNKDERVPEAFRIGLDMSKFAEAREAKAKAKGLAEVQLRIVRPDKTALQAPEKESPEYAVRSTAEQVLIKSLDARAARVDIGPSPAGDGTYAVRMLVDGVPQAGDSLPAQAAVSVIDFWKLAGALDVGDRRRQQRANITVEHHGVARPIAVATSGSQGGMRLSLTVDPAKAVTIKLKDLGLLEPQEKAVGSLVEDESGVVLLAGSPQGGRTSLLYALVRAHDAYTSNVQTLEYDMQTALEGVRQNIFNPAAGGEFSTTLRSILRRDPDVVAVSDLPDADTAREAANSDHERTRIYISMALKSQHVSAISAIQQYVRAVGDARKAADSLRGVIAEKLTRRLCPNCRVPYAPSSEMLAKLNVQQPVEQLFKKGGQVLVKNRPETCPMCNGGGYIGQVGLFEVYPLDDEDRTLIAQQNFQGLTAKFRKSGLPSLQRAGILTAVSGATSVEEVLRVTSPTPATPATAAANKPDAKQAAGA